MNSTQLQVAQDLPLHARGRARTHPFSHTPCACRIPERRRVRQWAGAWELAKNVRGGKGRHPRSSPTDVNCTAPPQAFHFTSC